MKEVWFVNKNRCATVIYFDKKLEFECLELIFSFIKLKISFCFNK